MATVKNAQKCEVVSNPPISPPPPAASGCKDGNYRTVVSLPPAGDGRYARYAFSLEAWDGKVVTESKPVNVILGKQVPVITSFTGTPSTLGQPGGTVTLTGTVKYGVKCFILITPPVVTIKGFVPCSLGSFSTKLTLPANPTDHNKTITLHLKVVGPVIGPVGHHIAPSIVSSPFTVTISGHQPPGVTSFIATPTSLPQSGGQVTLTAAVTHATTCRFFSVPALPGLPDSVPCSNGTATATVTVPANKLKAARTIVFRLVAQAKPKPFHANPVTVIEDGPPPTVHAFRLSQTTMGYSGGYLTVSAAVTSANKCVFSVAPALKHMPRTFQCRSGAVTFAVHIGPNKTSSKVTYTFSLTASGPSGTANGIPKTLTVEPKPAPASTTTTKPKPTTTTKPKSAKPASQHMTAGLTRRNRRLPAPSLVSRLDAWDA